MALQLTVLLVICLVVLVVCSAGTEYDNSMKARPDQQKTSKAHKSIADIIAKAAGKIDKTRTKQQNPNVEVKPSKRKTASTSHFRESIA